MSRSFVSLGNDRANNDGSAHVAAQVRNVRQRTDKLRHLRDNQLATSASAMRETLLHAESAPNDELLQAFALSLEAIRRTLALELYDVQIIAASALAGGRVAEMQTGEGKTLVAAPAAILRGLTGQGVHIVTPNTYLAHRDFELLKPAYEMLGLSVGLLPERSSSHEKRTAYQCDITYGPGYEFGFDYLRDQISLRSTSQGSLGEDIMARLRGHPSGLSTVIQRSRAFAIVDEVDNVLIDDAESPLILSDAACSVAEDAEVHQLARIMISRLEPDRHFSSSRSRGIIVLTPQGRDLIHAPDVSIPVKQLRRSWTEYVEQALRAELLFRRDVHYVVEDQSIRIVDGSTGRIFADRTWRDGFHQAIEAKEILPVTCEKNSLAQITRQRFFRFYERLSGMTGTAAGCEREFKTVYGLNVTPIPLRVPSRREEWPLRSYSSADAKWTAIALDVASIHRTGRPVLVGTSCISASEHLADMLSRRGLSFQLLNGRQDAEEAEIISNAGHAGTITLATSLAGRGTDITLDDNVRTLGGLHVVVSEPHESSRVDRQLVGRCARQGDPGSAQTYVSADDSLIQLHGPWLNNSMQRGADRTGEVRMNLDSRIRRLQQAAERAQFARRSALLRRDLARDSLMSQLDCDS